jgi:immune inhibitor A
MRSRIIGLLAVGVLALPISAMFSPGAFAAPPEAAKGSRSDNIEDRLSKKQSDRRKQALAKLLKGEAVGQGANKVVQVAKGQFVELARQGEDNIFTIVAQFGTQDSPFAILKSGIPGPLRNAIPEPDRSKDNTTIWAPDFSPAYYENMLFSEAPGAISMRNFYIEQSSGRYAVKGDVTDWVTVPYNAAHYGRDYCGGIVCQQTWRFVQDAANAWYNQQIAAGQTVDEINAYLSQFDTWDRYDQDGDGDFNEPDGYIDHFQIVHAGEGQETGGGAQGSDAIWSHRWAVQYPGGPTLDDGTSVPYGGTRIGQSKYWIRDYTVEPENGGVGVFAHEYGHDLGLPDLYDTSGNTGGASNSVEFWSLYSRGSYGSTGVPSEGIGSKPISMSAYEKIFLNWSNYQVVGYGQQASVKLGPAAFNTRQTQQLVALLPDKVVTTQLGFTPYAGSYLYFSGSGGDLDNTMTRQVTLPAGAVSLTAKVRYAIEQDWDYAYLTVNGNPVATNRSSASNPNNQNFGNGITGSTGGAWVDLTADLSAFAGQTVTIGWRYWTDCCVAEAGFAVDDIAVSGQPVDGGETDPGWTYDGFARTDGELSSSYFNAYVAEYRNYLGYDDGLRTGPYNFGFTNNPALANWVEHYQYQDGMLVWYWDSSFSDNNVGDHCAANNCGGLVLPVDAHPNLLIRADGKVWGTAVQSYDSTFGLQPTDAYCLHRSSVESCFGGLPGNRLFDDMQDYWVAPDPSINHFGWTSVPVPHTGTTIRVLNTSAQGNFMQVHVNK